MAGSSSADLILRGLNQAGQGIDTLGASLERSSQRDLAEEERLKKEAQQAELNTRLGNAATTVGDLANRIKTDPNFTRRDFEAQAASITAEGIQAGQPNLGSSVNGLRSIFDQRDADAKREQDALKEKTKSAKADKKQKNTDFKDRAGRLEKQIRLFRGAKEFKETQAVGQSFDKINRFSKQKPSAARDFGIVFSVMKALDPGSTVREGEFDNVKKARSFISNGTSNQDGSVTSTSKDGKSFVIPSAIVALVQKLNPEEEGSFLLPEQVTDFTNLAKTSFSAQLERQAKFETDTTAIAEAVGVDPKLVIGSDTATSRLEGFKKEREALAKVEKERQQDLPIEPGNQTVVSADMAKSIANDPQNPLSIDFLEKKAKYEQLNGRPMTDDEEHKAFLRHLDANQIKIQN